MAGLKTCHSPHTTFDGYVTSLAFLVVEDSRIPSPKMSQTCTLRLKQTAYDPYIRKMAEAVTEAETKANGRRGTEAVDELRRDIVETSSSHQSNSIRCCSVVLMTSSSLCHVTSAS